MLRGEAAVSRSAELIEWIGNSRYSIGRSSLMRQRGTASDSLVTGTEPPAESAVELGGRFVHALENDMFALVFVLGHDRVECGDRGCVPDVGPTRPTLRGADGVACLRQRSPFTATGCEGGWSRISDAYLSSSRGSLAAPWILSPAVFTAS